MRDGGMVDLLCRLTDEQRFIVVVAQSVSVNFRYPYSA